MRLYALIKNNVVQAIELLNESSFRIKMKEYDSIVDVQDMTPQPAVNWILQGNKLVHFNENLSLAEAEDLKMRARFKVGNEASDEAVILISARNRALNKTSAEVNQLIATFAPIEMAMRKCALPTAIGGITLMKPGFPEYEDIFDIVINKLSNYLASEV